MFRGPSGVVGQSAPSVGDAVVSSAMVSDGGDGDIVLERN
jgi:hypothetical protein